MILSIFRKNRRCSNQIVSARGDHIGVLYVLIARIVKHVAITPSVRPCFCCCWLLLLLLLLLLRFSTCPIWAPMGPHGPPWAHMGPHGPIWAPMGTHGL